MFDSMYTDHEQDSKSQILSVLKQDSNHVKFHAIPVQHLIMLFIFAFVFKLNETFYCEPNTAVWTNSANEILMIVFLIISKNWDLTFPGNRRQDRQFA